MRLSKRSNHIPSLKDLVALKQEIAQAAQKVYDEWEQEDEHGGICDQISSAIIGVLQDHGFDAEEGGHDGDDHSYAVIRTSETHGFAIDIDWRIYEKYIRHYEYKKIEGVKFTSGDVDIQSF